MKLMLPLTLFVIGVALVQVEARRDHRAIRMRANGKPGCKYSRKAQWTECGVGVATRQRVMKLKRGNPAVCAPTHTQVKPCKNEAKKMKNSRGKACKYYKGPWSECDAGKKTRTRHLTLKNGDKNVCHPRKTITKKCKKVCKYNKGPWLPCDEATNTKTRELTLKKGDPYVCNATTTIVKPCRRRGAFTGAKTSRCRYKPLPWGECDSRTNTMTRILKLKSGDPALCQQSKHLTRKCRKPCKFSKGNWSECDELTSLRKRTDYLVKGDASMCEATRVISKKCGKEDKCVYEMGDWSSCDRVSGQRTRVKRLTSGSPEKCQQEFRIQRPCLKPNGEESCFLGNWGEYGPCLNGVMMKHRPVIAGGVECERKAVKTKPCS